MDKNKYFKKMLVLLIITIFFCTGFSQCISASIQNDLHEKSLISPSKNDEVATLTFYTFDKTGRKQNTVELSTS